MVDMCVCVCIYKMIHPPLPSSLRVARARTFASIGSADTLARFTVVVRFPSVVSMAAAGHGLGGAVGAGSAELWDGGT